MENKIEDIIVKDFNLVIRSVQKTDAVKAFEFK